jgi:hypothetical protein
VYLHSCVSTLQLRSELKVVFLVFSDRVCELIEPFQVRLGRLSELVVELGLVILLGVVCGRADTKFDFHNLITE